MRRPNPAAAAGTPPLDSIAAKRYQPVGQCIYCGATKVPLTKEHIVPYALNGNWILPQASCKKCAAITGAGVEQAVLGGELQHLRTVLNFQTRRPSDRPVTVRLRADDRDVDVPITDCPIIMPFIRFPAPGLLDNRPSKHGIDVIGQVSIRWGPDPDEFAKRHGFRKVSFQATLKPAMFARMLAKIAYSHAVARFGLNALQDEFVTGVILGRSDRIGDVVGCIQVQIPVPQNPIDHVLHPVTYGRGTSGVDRLLAVRVKLFAGYPTPVYEVVLGRPADWLQDLPDNYHRE